MPTQQHTHPPIDPEVAAALTNPTLPPPSMRPEDIAARRAAAVVDREALLRGGAVSAADVVILQGPILEGPILEGPILEGPNLQGPNLQGPRGNPELHALVLRPARRANRRVGPGIVYIHGGGMVLGDAHVVEPVFVDAVLAGCTVISPQYRLAPEHPYPAALNDCLATWCWACDHATDLGMDATRLSLAGSSAGGGLAAGTTLAARDRGVSMPQNQILLSPMLDDRETTASSTQLDGEACWDRTANHTAWSAYLGERRGTEAVSTYAAPARATNVAGLPPTFIDVGAVDTFRDEDIAYAARLSRAGVPVELHVWPGAVHGFTTIAPDATVSRAAIRARADYLAKAVLR